MATKSPASDIVSYLDGKNIGSEGGSSGWGIFASMEPDGPGAPDSVITIYDTPGGQPSQVERLNKPAIQVRVRGSIQDYDGAYDKIQEIQDELIGLNGVTINTLHYMAILADGEIFSLGYDEKDRPILVQNYTILREIDTGSHRG